MQTPLALIALQDRQAAILRAIVGGDDPIHSLVEMKADHAVKDVCFISAEQGEHQLHEQGPLAASVHKVNQAVMRKVGFCSEINYRF